MILTKNSIAMILSKAEVIKPILQVRDIRLVNTNQSTTERYGMLLSDGDHTHQAMLTTRMNGIVKDGRLQKGSIVMLDEFICTVVQERRLIIVMNLKVLVGKCDQIGEPKNYDSISVPSQTQTAIHASSSLAEQQLNMPSANPQPHASSQSSSPTGQQNMMIGTSVNPGPSYNASANAVQGKNMSNVGDDSYITCSAQNQIFSNMSNTSNTAYCPPGNAFGISDQHQQPPSIRTNRGPIFKNETPVRITPISALNSQQDWWTIKAQITSKGELRQYKNPRGEGKVFSFDLLDSGGGEIRVTCFNLVADKFYDQIKAGNVYLISKGTLKEAQKNFNHLNHKYEILLGSTSTIHPCPREDNSIPKQQFNFRSVIEIESIENNSMVDVIGIVSSVNPAASITRKNGMETRKRTLQLKDMSGRSLEMTLWGNFCNVEGQQLQDLCDSGNFPVLAVKALRVSEFQGKSIGTISTSQLFINPDTPEAHRLKEWFNREGKSVGSPLTSIKSQMGRTDTRKTVAQIKDEGLGRSEKPDWITVVATVSAIKTDFFCYTACPLMVGDRQCNKKVINIGDGMWQCENCDQSIPNCDYRYVLQFQIQDYTGMTWVTAFQETGEEIMGVPAKKLYELKFEEQDDAKFAEITRNVLFNLYSFKLKVKEETFNDERRVKSTVVKAEKVNPSSESTFLLRMIEKLSLDSSSNPSAGTPSMESKPSVQ